MSSKLKKKSKNKYFTKNDIVGMKNYASRVNDTTDSIIKDTYYNIRLIAYQILHDKFGFGKKRIIRLENTIDTYLLPEEEGGLHFKELEFVLKQKYNIDVKKEANKVPFRERFALTTYKTNAAQQQVIGTCILSSICNYFALLGVCLKTQFKFSTKQILKAYWHIRDYINTLSRYKQFELTIDMIAESVKEEIGYCDHRYVNKKGEIYE